MVATSLNLYHLKRPHSWSINIYINECRPEFKGVFPMEAEETFENVLYDA